MGGGSSNAAAVLTGLNKLWSLNLPKAGLARLAAEIGSDVPFFVYDCAFALVKGRGERIKPLPDAQTTRLWHIIAVPDIHVSTPLIYKQWDKLSASKKNSASVLTMPPSDAKLILLALSGQKRGLSRLSLFNSLEPAAISLFPQVRRVKDEFFSFGIDKVLMSGSGPAVFGVVPTRKEAESFSKRLKSKHKLWRVFVAKTV
jgi:4-diphosphocytidyl-2-C-methyl-D-erythritol kinase